MSHEKPGLTSDPIPEDFETILKVNIIEGTSKLITALKSDRAPSRGQNSYEFPISMSNPIHMPTFITESFFAEQVQSITVSISKEDDDQTAIGFDFFLHGDKYLKTSAISYSDPSTERPVILNPHKLEAPDDDTGASSNQHLTISQRDANAIIQSILEPEKNSDYNHSASFNFHDPRWFQGLADGLARNSHIQRIVGEYDDATEVIKSLHYVEENGVIFSTDLACKANDYGRYFRVRVDFQRGIQMNFYDETHNNNGSIDRHEFFPALEELQRIQGMITRAGGKVSSPRPLSLDALEVDEAENRLIQRLD